MTKKDDFSQRQYWGKIYPSLPQIDLLAIQKQSYDWFIKEGIPDAISEISPIEDFTGKNWTLSFGKHSLTKPKITPKEAMEKGLTYEMALKVECTLVNKQTGEKIKQEVFLGDIPAMTEQGTFVISGIERVVVNQLVRSPGVFFTAKADPVTGKKLFQAEIRPMHGSWLEFSTTRNDVIAIKIDRKRKFLATTFLRAIEAIGGGRDEEILDYFAHLEKDSSHQFIKSTIAKDSTKTAVEALVEIFKKMKPGEPIVLNSAKELLANMFFSFRRYNLGRVGRYKLNRKLGNSLPETRDYWVLTKEDIVKTVEYLISLANGKGEVDDIDHLANRRVRCVGELVATTAFRVGLLRLERMVKERMSIIAAEIIPTPIQLINARPIIAAINEFFRTSQLSTILDQTNPLSEVDNLRRLTVMGTGGISKERASFSIRDINSSQYSRICPIRSPEGPNIGLVTYMALFTRINDYGFMEAPYRKVVKEKRGKKLSVRVTSEIVYLSADDEQRHYITHAGVSIDKDGILQDQRVPARHQGEFVEVDREQVTFIDIVPRQVVGTAASLIPFLAHDEANRALMGTHMQCQAVPLVRPNTPIVGTGMEGVVASVFGRVVRSEKEGKVSYVDANKIIVKTNKEEQVYLIEKFKRSAQSTCYSQTPRVKIGQKIEKGQILIDGPASNNGELALGQDLTIAYASFDGLGYEDAIIISDRLVKEDLLTSVHIEKYEASMVETKLGPEETTRDIPNAGEEDLANLDEEGIVVVGSEVGPNDILVGKIAPKGETELTAEERLLRAIFGEKAREVRDTSLRMPHGERGIVVGIQVLDREQGDELEPGTNKKIIVKVAQIRHVVVGDKLAGRHGNKGVISKIVPSSDMPYLEDGSPVDIIISPLSVLARMNLGQILEAHLGWAADRLGFKISLPVFEKFSEEKLLELLKKAGLPPTGKATLYDGRTGQAYENPVVVGKAYIMKLIHMVEDKTHARSTGPYSLVTQQPLGGKAQMGGQRLGEMEVWALEAHRAAYTLQEMLTIKSDDVVGRAKAFEAIVKGSEIPTPKVPESFKVLVKELQGMGLNISPIGAIREETKTEVVEEVKNAA
ncbi:DNA-directed RNA polymerase subunit beta [Candidatus Microgenomates bacterium]|nr:DNA-directed RNA polymerase subunit beta [Candidatus Microgenomates bacterium]